MKNKPVIVFMGTPLFSACVLEGLINNYEVSLIVTQPDRPVGRGGKIKFSPVKELAVKNNILCLQPEKIKDIVSDLKEINPDLIITCAYGKILPKEILDIPKIACINVHASLLPKLRGGAPIHHAIIDGYDETGITIMYMAEGMDDGDIISQESVLIGPNDTTEILHDKLKVVGRDLLIKTLPSILDGTNERTSQDKDLVTFGLAISKEDEHIDFNKTKKEVVNQIRGLNSWPGAYCYYDDKRMKVWLAREGDDSSGVIGQVTGVYDDGFGVKVSDGVVVFTLIQLEGKGKMNAGEFINGHADLIGKVLK